MFQDSKSVAYIRKVVFCQVTIRAIFVILLLQVDATSSGHRRERVFVKLPSVSLR